MSSAPLEPLRHIVDEIDFLLAESHALSRDAFLKDPLGSGRLREASKSSEKRLSDFRATSDNATPMWSGS